MRDSFNVITFSFNGVEHVIDDRMGRSNIEVTALMEEIAEHFKDDDFKSRHRFITQLINAGIKGIKLVSVEEVKIEKKKI